MNEAAAFLVTLVGITWPLGYFLTPWALRQGQTTFDVVLISVVWIPTVLALFFTRYFDGPGAIKKELRARTQLAAGTGWLVLVAGAAPLLIGSVSIMAARAVGDRLPFIPSSAMPSMIGLQVITGSTGEELGWRGFVLPRLRRQLGAAGAAAVGALLWATWHVPVFFTEGMPHRFWPMWSVLAAIAMFGLFLGTLFFLSGESVVPTMAAHVSLNVILGVGGANLASVTLWRTMAALYAGIGGVAFVRWLRHS